MERLSAVALLALAIGALPASAQAAESADPFGEADPFAAAERAEKRTEERAAPRARSMKADASFLYRNMHNQRNPDSRLNPGNEAQPVSSTVNILETRFTLSDHLDEDRRWRWLVKGFDLRASDHPNEGPLREETRADEFFVDWKGERWFANIGKRRVNWGHAQAFNPVNVIVPPRDPLDPSRRTEGQPMLWLSHSEGGRSGDLIVTRNYDRNYNSDQTRWGAKWQFAALDSDYALYYFDGERYRDGRRYERMLGGSLSANVYPGITLYLETARFERSYRNYYDSNGSVSTRSGAVWQGVIGSGLNLGDLGRIFAEYYRNGQGYSPAERVKYWSALGAQIAAGPAAALADFQTTAMNRSYLLIAYRGEFRERNTLDLSALAAADRSHSLRAQLSYALSDRLDASVVLLRNRGSRESEFGNLPVSNALELWLRASF